MFLRPPHSLALLPAVVACASLSAPLLAQAQSNAGATTTVVITGARQAELADRAVRPVQVLSADDIASAGVHSLPELLATLGGVEAVGYGGLGQLSSVFIRGANSNHTVVLVDGVRIGSATAGTAALESLPLALIDHVEVLAGASSSLYGADAIGGVIQIFTKRAEGQPLASMAVTAGQQGLAQLSATYAARRGDTEMSLGANLQRTDGFNATTPNNTYNYNPDRDGYSNRSAQVRVAQQLGQGHQVDVQWLRSDGTVHFDDGAPGDSRSINRTQTLAAHWAGPMGDVAQSEFRLARAWDDIDSMGSYPYRLSTTQDQAAWLNRVKLDAGQLNLGLEWLHQHVDSSDASYSVTSRDIGSALAGWRAAYGTLAVQADARYDDNSQFGGHPTGQLAAAWQWTASTRLRTALGTAFKAPTFNDLYSVYGANLNLQPERSTSLELGADWHSDNSSLSATWFDNQVRQLIVLDSNWIPQNVSRAAIRGLTLSANTLLNSATQLRASLSAQEPKNADTGAMLRRRARLFGDINLARQMGDVRLGTALHVVGQRYDSTDESPASRMGGYSLLALYGSWQLQRDWSLEARVDNLADKAYVQAIGYATQGRCAQMTLRWTPAL